MATMYADKDPFLPGEAPADLVNDGWARSQLYADQAFQEAQQFLDNIGNLSGQIADIPPVEVTGIVPGEKPGALVLPDAPTAPDDLAVHLPTAPTEPTLATVAPLALGNAPAFDATLPAINLDIPLPAPLSASLPPAPALNPVTLPAAPELALPAEPTALPIALPDVPTLNLPTWGLVLQEAPLPPAVGDFSFTEERYTSELLETLRERLLEWVQGAATGISPDVERALWARTREREAGALLQKAKEAVRGFASRGFAQPPGAMAVALADAAQASQDRAVDLSRDIAIKQAELEQSNRHFAFQEAWQVESGLISYAGQIAARAFEAAKFALEIGIEVFKAQIAGYTASVEAFKARAVVFEAQLRAELARLDIYKAQLEGQKLVGELNLQAVEAYKARIQAVTAQAELFKAQIEGAAVAAQVNRAIVEAFTAQVAGYKATVEAKAAEYDGYASRVKAEVAKGDVFKSQADAYRSQVEGFRALVEARVAEKSAEIKIGAELPMDLFKARTEAYRTGVQAEAERVRAVASTFETQAQVYSAEVRAQAERVSAETQVFKAEADIAVAGANLQIEAAKANIQKLVSQVTLLSESVRAGAQVSAQLAAAALSSINLSGGISTSESFSHSDARSSSETSSSSSSGSISTSYIHNYNES